MPTFDRRLFLKSSGISIIPAILPVVDSPLFDKSNHVATGDEIKTVKFFGDGEMFEPADYIKELEMIQQKSPITKDRYGIGGAVELLEQKFCELTGKEKCISLPSGTMANQLAISLLSGEKSKVFLQETSHVYRDEGDAAQLIFNKRLMPLRKDEAYFTCADLENAITKLKDEEAFTAEIGAISIENPVRRSDGKYVPLEEIKKISKYCRDHDIGLHLDGARIYMASAWTGVSVKEYASYFDTIYISLYKYFGAASGGILCGDARIIDKMPHLIKVHGGSIYGNWMNAAMALSRIEGFEGRLTESIKNSEVIFNALNKLKGIKISKIEGGTNIQMLELAPEINALHLQENLLKKFNIKIPKANDQRMAKISVNETFLYRPTEYIINAFRESLI